MTLKCGPESDAAETKSDKKLNASTIKLIVSLILWLSLFVSSGYAIYRIIITAPDAVPPDTPRTQSDYILMLVSCIGGIIIMGLPSFIGKKLKVVVPDGLTIAYFIFLYAGVFLGEVQNYFHVFAHWDVLLHSFSGGLLAILGFKLICLLNDWDKLDMHLSPFFIALFGFCFAVTIGVIWEIYEFSADSLLGMNMQKYMTESGEKLIGQAALQDTMEDFIVNVASAFIVSVAGYFSVKNKQRTYHKNLLTNFDELADDDFPLPQAYGPAEKKAD